MCILIDYIAVQNLTKNLISMLEPEEAFLLMVLLPKYTLREELIPDSPVTLCTLFTMVQRCQSIEFLSELHQATGDDIAD